MNEKVSRRGFLRTAGLGAVGLAAIGVTGCAPQAKEAAVEVKASSGDPLASTSSTDWLGSAPEIDDNEVTEHLECDILVVGAGTAGHFAAMSAVESGARVVLIEKGAEGGFGIRYQLGAVNTQLQQTAPNPEGGVGVAIDRNGITEDFGRYANYYNNADLVHLWYDKSGPIIDFYNDLEREAGLKPHFINLTAHPDASWMEWPTGNEVLDEEEMKVWEPVERYIAEGGADMRFETALVKLIREENGPVTGAYARKKDGDYLRIDAAKGVVVCTGGYAQNPEMMAALQPQTCELYSYIAAPPTNTGDGIKACLWVGAAQDPNHSAMLFERTMVPPDALGGVQSVDVGKAAVWCAQPWLSVDLEGNRFCNEAGPYDYRLHAISNRPGRTYVTLVDSNYEEHIRTYDTFGCSRNVVKNPTPQWDGEATTYSKDGVASLVKQLEAEDTYVQKADTWEELAGKLGLPADNLVATVARYNELCEKGIDEDYGKDAYRMVPYTTPPFYGVRTTGRFLCTFDGIRINTQMQALDADNNPIEGLYCAGNDSGCYFDFTYPNIATGAAGGRSATFGWLAVKNALGETG